MSKCNNGNLPTTKIDCGQLPVNRLDKLEVNLHTGEIKYKYTDGREDVMSKDDLTEESWQSILDFIDGGPKPIPFIETIQN